MIMSSDVIVMQMLMSSEGGAVAVAVASLPKLVRFVAVVVVFDG